ncbi:nucleotidyltransferase family protein [Jiangella asiatica]|nr:nucleotidyltransferase family protein [Jiangella asiatica]
MRTSTGDGEAARRRHPISAAVVAVCRATTPSLPATEPVRRGFVDAVRHHRVAPLAHVLLRDDDPDLAAVLKVDRDAAMIRHLTAGVVLGQLSTSLGELPWATVKGPVLSEYAHPAPGLRTYTDVDVLVAPGELRTAARRLLDAGWQVIDFRDMLCNVETPGEMHLVSPAGVLVDLHWSLINMSPTRRRFSVDTEQLLGRRRTVSVAGSATWTLDAADSLVHVCLHAALTGAHKMIWLLDADQLARRTERWDDVVDRALAWGAGPAVALVLARARAVLGTPLPADLDRRLGISTGFRLVTATVDRLRPVPRLRRDASIPRLVARSVRSTGGRTLTTLGTRSLRGLTDRLRVTGARSGPPAVREPADGEAVEKYLSAVEAQVATP